MKYILIILTAFTLFSCNQKKETTVTEQPMALDAERVAIFADPTVQTITITDLAGVTVDTNNLRLNQSYLLKLRFGNVSTTALPIKTAYIAIGAGMGLTAETPLITDDGAMKYYYRKLSGRQQQISALIENGELPQGFIGTAVFKVKATALGVSTASVNFLIYNQNSGYILADIQPNNNSGAISYTVK